MAKNDTILLDGILDDRVIQKLPSDKRDEVFEFFSIEQILKDFNLSKDEIISGLIDGRNDGGIDAFYIIVNGHLLIDPESFFWPRTSTELDVHVITCKHHETFKQATFDNLAATLTEIFNLSKETTDLKSEYSDELVKKRELLKGAYRKLSPRLTKFSIHISYASRGDASNIGESIVARGNQIEELCKESFGGCTPCVEFFGSTELVQLSRKKPNFSLELPFLEVLARGGERYVLLSRLVDYNRFITDDQGKLRRYLFDSNVRDFMGLNRVNEDIKSTLENENSPDFWWLNNGVTILATKALVIGKTIHIEDIQIVNGLQTTESIHKYFTSGGKDSNERSVLVKVIVSQQNVTRDSIIRATNNQTNVELSALHATDKIQRDIEDILLKNGLYYERRTNYYSNQGILPSLIVTPLYLASGFVNLILKDTSKASNLKSRFMRSPESYEKVFSPKISIAIWPVISWILKKTDGRLEKLRSTESGSTDRFLKRWRHVLSYLIVSRLLKKFDFTPTELMSVNLSDFNDKLIDGTWAFIKTLNIEKISKEQVIGSGKVLETFRRSQDHFSISGFANLVSRYRDASTNEIDKKPRQKKESQITDKLVEQLDEEFIRAVKSSLPAQPWKPGMHLRLSAELSCSIEKLALAINKLIVRGQLYKQKDGVLFNRDGGVVGYDEDRVDPLTLRLKEQ
jgi:hypothetical protein